ncbi:hypothetical protein Ddye_005830 [Dipteronia dyeriana]|uniref:MULE transposase domain-containing protein n=1 Tax=Dipteronia dyeriana TaxID=168575 RepID=A0AAD9XHE8_9ROSI|nr:hypothetical protein Ddye_005830 [Dipteronia dyeriana]
MIVCVKDITYDELVSIVQTVVKYGENKYSVYLQSVSIFPGTTCRTFIRNDDDVQFMLGEDRVIPQVFVSPIESPAGDNLGNNEEDEELVQTERYARRVHRFSYSAPDIAETSKVWANVTQDDYDNTTTWVIPEAESYLFVITVDGTHLKGRFRGTMFVATVQYGNEQVYPIAFGYDDSDYNLSWEWFLDCLKGALCHIDDQVFISDRHASIEVGISKLFPYATHTKRY